ncbi:hypothetical protein FCV25MIE_26445 [Fagus crenata]
MSCIQSHAPLLPLHSQLKHKTHPRTAQLLWLPSCERTEFIQHRPNKLSLLAPRINAIPDSLVLGASSTVKGGDISVLLPTGAVLLFAYFITNFIMPIIVSKDLGLDKASEDQKRNDD